MNKYMETVDLKDAPCGHTFTQADDKVSVVFYEDTQSDDLKKTYHSYLNGDLFATKAYPQSGKKFIACDRYGNYIPKSYIDKMDSLQKQVKELTKEEFICTLQTNYTT